MKVSEDNNFCVIIAVVLICVFLFFHVKWFKKCNTETIRSTDTHMHTRAHTDTHMHTHAHTCTGVITVNLKVKSSGVE